jgi:hypothetical protein
LKQSISPNQETPEAPPSPKKRLAIDSPKNLRAIVESSTEDDDSVAGEETNFPPPPLPTVPPAAVFNPYAKATISSLSDLASVAVFIRQGAIYKDQEYIANLRTTNFKSKGNLNKTEKMISRLFCCLNAHPILHFLAAEIQDPESPDLTIRRLFLECRGSITEPKKEVLNAALILFAESFYLKKYEGVDVAKLPDKEQADVSRGSRPNFVAPGPILGAP